MTFRRREDAVLFDLDGVMVDSRAAVAGCINYALRAHGLAEQPQERLLRFIGPPLAIAFSELTAKPPESALVAACVESYRDRYADASLRETFVVPGIPEALRELAADHRLAVATSKPRAFAEPLLHRHGLHGSFDVIAAPDLKVQTEAKAMTIGEALDALRPLRAVMVGDRSFDIAGARAHGLPAIGVSWGIGSRDELVSAGADALIDAPSELRAASRRLLATCRLPRLSDRDGHLAHRKDSPSRAWPLLILERFVARPQQCGWDAVAARRSRRRSARRCRAQSSWSA